MFEKVLAMMHMPWLRYYKSSPLLQMNVFKLLRSSYIVWNTIFISTDLWLFCPVVRPQGQKYIQTHRISSRSSINSRVISIFVHNDSNMWHFALLICCSLPLFQHLYSSTLSSTDLCVEYFCMCIFCGLNALVSEHNSKCLLVVSRTKPCFGTHGSPFL